MLMKKWLRLGVIFMIGCGALVRAGAKVDSIHGLPAKTAENFIVQKSVDRESTKNLSKNGVKERMGESVRDGLHTLFDIAQSLVKIQRASKEVDNEILSIHDEVIGLQRTLSRVAEALVDDNPSLKNGKVTKKQLEESLHLLQDIDVESKGIFANLKKSKKAAIRLSELLKKMQTMRNRVQKDERFKNL